LEQDAMDIGQFRSVLTGAVESGARRLRASWRGASMLAVVLVAAAVVVRPAASGADGGVAAAPDCRMLLARAPAPEPLPPQVPPQRRLLDVVTEFVERSVPDGQRYVFPTGGERARFQCGFQYAAAGRFANARRLLEPLQYDVKQLIDTGTAVNRALVLLVERKSTGRDGVARYRHAWGLYVIAARTVLPALAVEVPHQCKSTARCNTVGGDRRTHTMAVTTFERARAKYLFVAGTDRGATATGCPRRPCSADVAHEEASMFEAVHEAALAPRLPLPAAARTYQPHGFSTGNHPPSCQEAVVSAGLEQDASPGIETTRLARRVAAALNADPSDVYGRKVLLYGRDVFPRQLPDGRVDCSPQDDPTGGLGATTNVQGQFAAQLTPARDFLSVESSQHVRNLAAERDALSNTIADVLSAP
jgi:hypothetical protein